MKHSKYSWMRKAYMIAAAAFFCVYISGCGASDENTTSQKEFVYVPEFQKIDNGEGGPQYPVVSEDNIYYICDSYGDGVKGYTAYLCQLKIGEKEPVKSLLNLDENATISNLSLDEEGNLQAMVMTSIFDDTADGTANEGTTPAEDDTGGGDLEESIPEEDADTPDESTPEDETQDDSSEDTASIKESDSVAVVNTSSSGTAVSVTSVSTATGADYDYQEPTSQKVELCKLSTDGKILSAIDISESLNSLDNPYIQYLITDNDGNIYITNQQTIIVLNKEGKELFRLEIDNWINSMFAAKDGTVLVSYYGKENMEIHTIDLQQKSMGEAINNIMVSPYANYVFAKGIDTDLLFSANNILYSYNFGDQAPIEILNWIDCDVNSNEVVCFIPLQDGRILAVNSYWKDSSNTMELIYLTKKKGSEVPEKVILTYATMSLDYDLRKKIIEFNRTNTEYRVEVKEYMSNTDDYQTAQSQFNAAMVSGKAPDIMDISYGVMSRYVQKGLVTDLYPYLDKDPELKREDYLENVLNAYGQDGKLYGMAPRFYIGTVVARVSDVGDRRSITLDELMNIVDEMPENTTLYDFSTKSSVLMNNVMLNMDEYINWSTGECNLNGEEFIKVLEFANKFDLEYNYDEEMQDMATRLKDGSLMMFNTSVSSVQEYQMMELLFGEPIAFIGYPTNGENGSFLGGSGSMLAMNAKSKHKDGVWQFIRMGITKESQEDSENLTNWGFPIMKSALEIRFEQDMTEEYYELPDGTKQKSPKSSWGGFYGVNADVYAATEEQIEIVRNYIGSVDSLFHYDEDLYDIINEEVAAYFEGQKSAKEVAEIIQNRVQIYVSENR